MKCVTVNIGALALLGALCGLVYGQYYNNRPYPTYSLEHMPDTGFSCRDKVLGGYYADSETQCQMFHVCVKVAGLGVQDFRFLCPNGTAFDQDSQICADWDDVDCEAATLYYSSDNFDLYRVGSGFETAAFPGEDEATFHLQRSETGDARLSHEHQSARVNQQTNFNTAFPPKKPTPHGRDRDLLRGSSSSNFFNNRNGGKDLDDDDYADAGAPNQNSEITKKKIVRKFNNRKPVDENYESQTQKSNKFTGFSNNFAGSIPTSTVKAVAKEQYPTGNGNYRGRQNGRNRGSERQYNNAENFRNNNNDQYNVGRSSNNERNQYSTQQSLPSTPAPFRQTSEVKYKTVNRQNTQYNNQNDNGQYNPTTAAPKPAYSQFDNQRVRQQPQTESGSTAAVKQQSYNTQYPSKQTENYPSTAVPYKQTDYSKQTIQYKKETENYPTTVSVTNKQSYDVQKKPTTQFKQTENYPTTFAPNKQTYQKQTTQYYQNKETENYSAGSIAAKQTTNTQNDYTNKQTSLYTQSDYKQYDTTRNTAVAKSSTTQQQVNTNSELNTKQTNQYSQSVDYSKQQYDNTRSYQTTQYNQQYSTTSKPTTQHTQYTPTVPKQTTQYQYSSTTPSARFSKQFDETSYDDGSYNAKYDDEKYKSDDEFLKTAHSSNYASARNEFLNNAKINHPSTQSPRPFSATTQATKTTNQSRPTQNVSKTTSNTEKQTPDKTSDVNTQPAKKPEKDVSYDYAYYDTNVGSEPDYDVGTEFSKSTKKTK